MNTERVIREVQYGVRYGDGEVEEVGETPADAWNYLRSLRLSISEGHLDGDDYEPMIVVRREVVTTVDSSDWKVV